MARTGQPVIIRNAAEYAGRYPGPRAAVVLAEEASWLIWPLTVGKATVGSIVLMWRRQQRFQPGQLAFIAAVADLVAHALVRARIYADEHASAASALGTLAGMVVFLGLFAVTVRVSTAAASRRGPAGGLARGARRQASVSAWSGRSLRP